MFQARENGKRRGIVVAVMAFAGIVALIFLSKPKDQEVERPVAVVVGKEVTDFPELPGIAAASARTEAMITDDNVPAKATSAVSRDAMPDRKTLAALLGEARRRITPIDDNTAEISGNEGITHFFQNPGQNLMAKVGQGGLYLEVPGQGLKTSLKYQGAGAETVADFRGSQVNLRHADGVMEWFRNTDAGIEQGFELPHAISDSGKREVVVRLGDLKAEYAPNGQDLVWTDADNVPVMGYSGLKVNDARGVPLDARMMPDGEAFRIVFNDRAAIYPVSIDPLITTLRAKLGPPMVHGDGESLDEFGESVATDGVRLAIGADRDSVGSVYVFVKQGEDWVYETKIMCPAGHQGRGFGTSLAIDGTQLIIGAEQVQGPFVDGNILAYVKGAVFVYTRDGSDWSLTQKIHPDLGSDLYESGVNHRFGCSLALDGDTFIVGADGNIAGSQPIGYACIFTRTGGVWSQQARIVSPQGQSGDCFGYSVAIDGDVALIGRPTTGAGDVFVFSRQGSSWSQEAKWTGSVSGDRFGHSVAISGNVAVVGANSADTSQGIDAGNATVFRRTSGVWNAPVTLQPSNGAAGDRFGSSLAFEGNRLVVGSIFCNSKRGGAYLFEWTGSLWQAVTSFLPTLGFHNGSAGWSVAMSGDDVFVGAYNSYNGYLYQAGNVSHHAKKNGVWQERPHFSAGDGESGQLFGAAVATDGSRVLVGMEGDHTLFGASSGSAYVFLKQGDDWNLETVLMDSDPANYEMFGRSVDIDGNRLVVGNPSDKTGASIVCFKLDQGQWIADGKARPTGGLSISGFGSDVSVEGDRVMGCGLSGGARVFNRQVSGWVQEAELLVSGSSSPARRVILEQGRAYVSYPAYNGAGFISPGCVQEFVRSGTIWSEGPRIASPLSGYMGFAHLFAVSGNHLIASQDNDKVLAFVRDGGGVWQPNGELVRPSSVSGLLNGFGMAMALDGGTAAVGSSGAVVTYALGAQGWSLNQTLSGMTNPSRVTQADLAIRDNLVVVGLPNDSAIHPTTGDLIEERGSVFVFELGEVFVRMEVINREGQVVTSDENRESGVGTVGLIKTGFVYKIYNRGTIPLTGVSVTVEGPDAGDFHLNGGTAGISILPGESIEATIAFHPKSSGQKNGSLRISSDDAVTGTRKVHMTGYGNRAPAESPNAHLAVPGARTVIFLKDLAVDADGDGLELEPQAAVSGIWGSYTVFPDRIVFDAAPGFTGQYNMGFSVIDAHGAKSFLSRYVRPTVGPAAGPDRPLVAMGDGRWNISLGGGQPNQMHRVEHSTDMTVWKTLGSAMTDSAGRVTLMEHSGNVSKGFYRLRD